MPQSNHLPPSPSLLSPREYDDDASLRSPSEQDSDSEDDQFVRGSRTSMELAQYDRTVLDEEDEMEKLLTRSTGPTEGLRRIFSPSSPVGNVKIGKKEKRRRRRREQQGQQGQRDASRESRRKHTSENGEFLYEMDEGDEEDGEELLRKSEDDEEGYLEKEAYQDQDQPISWLKYALAFAAILVLLLILILGAYKASSNHRASRTQPLLSNGTTLFAPTTILISLDGFRADFLHRGMSPALSAFIEQGVSPQYMLPSFPSVTFPNHFTLVTGLYPESHGVVGNSFYDPVLDEDFYYTDSSISMQSKWWSAEPIWNTLEKQGIKSAIHMWPGSEAHIDNMDPAIVDKFNRTEALNRKTDRILELLDLPDDGGNHERPQFIAAYVPNVDSNGHKYGPNSTEVFDTIAEVDEMLSGLFAGLETRNLTDVVNVVIVSDHGMATTSTERLVQLEELVDLDLVDRIDGWPSRGLRPKDPQDLKILEDQLQSAAPNYSHAVEIYSRKTMPERYHFSNNDRIAPLWVIPKTGWAIVEFPELDAQKALDEGAVYKPRGIHGYDHEHPLMRAIFLARGPAFAYPPNSRLENFQNVNVYNILCDSLGVEPRPNNGTLRFPLQPVGLHSDEDVPVVEYPQDPVSTASPASTTSALSHSPTSSATPSTSPSATPAPVDTVEDAPDTPQDTPQDTPDTQDSDNPDNEDNEEESGSLWDLFWGTVTDIKDAAVGLIGGIFG